MVLLFLLLAPLSGGIFCALARSRRQMEIANVAAFSISLVLALVTAAMVTASGPIALWGGFLYADSLSALVCLLTCAVSLVCSVYAIGFLREDEDPSLAQCRKYYSLTPLFVAAMLLVTIAGNLGVMWVAIEATTLASVFLVTFYGKVTSIEAAWKYAIIGGVGLSMALFGTVLVFYSARALPGSDTIAGLNWPMLAAHAGQLDKTPMRLAFLLALLGYGTKAGLAPMHTWKPDAYSEAPVPSAALLSSATLNCAIYGLIRFYILTSRSLGPSFPGGVLLLLGVASMGIAAPFILLQKNFRRLLAYSSIDQAGIMAVALGVGGKLGALGLMLHMTYHTVAKSLLFLCAGNIYQHFHTDLFAKVRGGVMQILPVTGVIFLTAALAVAGMPPFSLFQSEFLIVKAAFDSGHMVTTALFVLFGAAIFAGILSQVGGMILGSAEGNGGAAERPMNGSQRILPEWAGAEGYASLRDTPILILAAALLLLAFWLPAPLLELIRGAARVVTGD